MQQQHTRPMHERLNGMMVRAIEETDGAPTAKSMRTVRGKSRFMIRAALNQRWLPNIIQAVRTWPTIGMCFMGETGPYKCKVTIMSSVTEF